MQDYFLIDGTLYHHGIMGQKWGRRRFQNEDGSLTPEGRARYGYGEARTKLYNAKQKYKITKTNENKVAYKEAKKEYLKSDEHKENVKKVLKVGAAVAGTMLAAYGTYKLYNFMSDKADNVLLGQINANKGELAYINSRISEEKENLRISKMSSGNSNNSDIADDIRNKLSVLVNEKQQLKTNISELEKNRSQYSNLDKQKKAWNLVSANSKVNKTSLKDSYKKYAGYKNLNVNKDSFFYKRFDDLHYNRNL